MPRIFFEHGSCQGLEVEDAAEDDSVRHGGSVEITSSDWLVGIGMRTMKPSSDTSKIQAGVGNVSAKDFNR